MRMIYLLFFIYGFGCNNESLTECLNQTITRKNNVIIDTVHYPPDSWQYFLQHLPIKEGPILDYQGNEISFQDKHVALINYDIGTTDLQQCADALMRLRAEYLFNQRRFSEIGFHFTSGDYYSWEEYCKGRRPRVRGNKVHLVTTIPSAKTHESLRKYLDIVYTYAGTISLNKELKPSDDFEIGTIIIQPGSPGHCCIIIDKAVNKEGENVYKLAEGYTPAQSIYVLSNSSDKEISPWYKLNKGIIQTSSYTFTRYSLKKFE